MEVLSVIVELDREFAVYGEGGLDGLEVVEFGEATRRVSPGSRRWTWTPRSLICFWMALPASRSMPCLSLNFWRRVLWVAASIFLVVMGAGVDAAFDHLGLQDLQDGLQVVRCRR